MRSKLVLTAVAVIGALMASSAGVSAAPCATNPIAIATFAGPAPSGPGCSFTVDGLTFTGADNLSGPSAGLTVGAGNIFLPPSGPVLPGIQIQGLIAAPPTADVTFNYTVTSTVPITDLHLFFAAGQSDGGVASVSETVFDLTNGGSFALAVQTPGTFSAVTFTKPTFSLFIVKDIGVSGGSTGFASISVVDQLFSVPEPATLLLLGSGLIGMALGQRRFGRK